MLQPVCIQLETIVLTVIVLALYVHTSLKMFILEKLNFLLLDAGFSNISFTGNSVSHL
jgi:hypothetical protein